MCWQFFRCPYPLGVNAIFDRDACTCDWVLLGASFLAALDVFVGFGMLHWGQRVMSGVSRAPGAIVGRWMFQVTLLVASDRFTFPDVKEFSGDFRVPKD